jgi:hypothetical protein
MDSHHGDVEGKQIYDDTKPEEIDDLDPNQPHRGVDIFVRDKGKELKDKGKFTIVIPPNIHGVGTGPVNRISIQIPMLIRFAIKHRIVSLAVTCTIFCLQNLYLDRVLRWALVSTGGTMCILRTCPADSWPS